MLIVANCTALTINETSFADIYCNACIIVVRLAMHSIDFLLAKTQIKWHFCEYVGCQRKFNLDYKCCACIRKEACLEIVGSNKTIGIKLDGHGKRMWYGQELGTVT